MDTIFAGFYIIEAYENVPAFIGHLFFKTLNSLIFFLWTMSNISYSHSVPSEVRMRSCIILMKNCQQLKLVIQLCILGCQIFNSTCHLIQIILSKQSRNLYCLKIVPQDSAILHVNFHFEDRNRQVFFPESNQ